MATKKNEAELNMDLVFDAQDLEFSYPLGETRVEALRGLSFQIKREAFLALSGPSGSGKSTLLNLLGLIEKVQKGRLSLFSNDLARISEKDSNQIRRFKIGFIFQNFHLMNIFNAYENVEYFLYKQNLSSKERAHRVKEALSSVGLWEHREKLPLKLSGGQRQRVAIARAIAKKPEIIIADEPTASLDQNTGTGIMALLQKLNKESGASVVISSHDPMVLNFCPEVWKLVDGKLQITS